MFFCKGRGQYCVPIHEGVMSEELPFEYGMSFSLIDENLSAANSVRRQITNAQFAGPLNKVLQNMMVECFYAYQLGEDYTEIVSEAYQKFEDSFERIDDK